MLTKLQLLDLRTKQQTLVWHFQSISRFKKSFGAVKKRSMRNCRDEINRGHSASRFSFFSYPIKYSSFASQTKELILDSSESAALSYILQVGNWLI